MVCCFSFQSFNIHINGVFHCTVRYSLLYSFHEQVRKKKATASDNWLSPACEAAVKIKVQASHSLIAVGAVGVRVPLYLRHS